MRPKRLRRQAHKQEVTGKRLVFALSLVVALTALGYSAARWAADPRFAAQIETVTGLEHTSFDDVVSAAAIPQTQNAWLIDRWAVERRIETLPWVSKARLNVAWPNKVSILVSERSAVARVELDSGSRPLDVRYALIDETRRILAVDSAGDSADLPFLVVVPQPNEALPGQTLDSTGVSQALAALGELRALGLRVSAVAIAPSTGISATADRNLRVLFGADEDLAAKAQLFEAIVAKISTPQRIAYIDVRSVHAPTVLYR